MWSFSRNSLLARYLDSLVLASISYTVYHILHVYLEPLGLGPSRLPRRTGDHAADLARFVQRGWKPGAEEPESPVQRHAYSELHLSIKHVYLPTYLSIYPSIYPSIYRSIYSSIDPSFPLSNHLSPCLSVFLYLRSIYPFIYVSIYLFIHVSTHLSNFNLSC